MYCCVCGKHIKKNEDWEIVDEGYFCHDYCYNQIEEYENNKDKWDKKIEKLVDEEIKNKDKL